MRYDNPECSGLGCGPSCTPGEVRVLPLSTASGSGSNLIVCRAHHAHEIAWRRDENRRLGQHAQWALPAWGDLKVYDGAGDHA